MGQGEVSCAVCVKSHQDDRGSHRRVARGAPALRKPPKMEERFKGFRKAGAPPSQSVFVIRE